MQLSGMVSKSKKLMPFPYNTCAEFTQVVFAKMARSLGANGIKIAKHGEMNKKMFGKDLRFWI